MVEAKLLPLARQWSSGDRSGLTADARVWRYRGSVAVPMWPLADGQWRVHPGGMAMRLPGWTDRCVALYKDTRDARAMLELEEALKRRAGYLMYQEDGWWFRCRFLSIEGLRKSRTTWKAPPQGPRWHKAPEGWPRDRYGRPLRTGAITAAVLRRELDESELKWVSARTATDVRRKLHKAGDS